MRQLANSDKALPDGTTHLPPLTGFAHAPPTVSCPTARPTLRSRITTAITNGLSLVLRGTVHMLSRF